MKVLFLTEHGDGIGYGHINRCMALADGFADQNCTITIISRGSDQAPGWDRDYQIINKEWNTPAFLNELLDGFDITVVDSYRVPNSTLKYIGQHATLPVYLIDSMMKFYPAGILLFPSIYAGKHALNVPGEVEQLAGGDYLLFTGEFWKVERVKIKRDLSTIGITLGGITDDIILEVLKHLKKSIPQLDEIAIYGSLSNRLKGRIDNEDVRIKGYLSKKDYVRELLKMDAMICNGGQSLNESLLLGIPALSFICADSQKQNAEAWKEEELALCMDVRNEFNKSEFLENIDSLSSYAYRKSVNKRCAHTIEYDGAIRAAQRILHIARKS